MKFVPLKKGYVMKEIVNQVKSFAIFDFPLNKEYIGAQFVTAHCNYKNQFPNWSLAATRRKMIAHFWLRRVLIHFLSIMLLPIVGMVFTGSNWHLLLSAGFLAGLITLLTLIIFNYGPSFYTDFLVNLDNIIAEQECLFGAAEGLKKCKRTQFSIPTLTIINHVYCKITNIPLLPCNDRSAELLNNLFGADKDKIKQNLCRLHKLSGLSQRERAEIHKGIGTARTFFEEIGCQAAQEVLYQLELKMNRD